MTKAASVKRNVGPPPAREKAASKMDVTMEQLVAEVRELRKEKKTSNPEAMEVILASGALGK